MLHLAHPWFLLLLLALPVAAWLRGRRGQPAAFLYSSTQLVRGVANLSPSSAGRLLAALRWLALACLIVALARPQFTQSETKIKASGIDIVVALDLSGSMRAEDFEMNRKRVNRLAIAKDVLKKFIEGRPGDRIGLVVFAADAFVASPMTLDHAFLIANLGRIELGLIDGSRTAIGSGLSTALNRLRDLQAKSKIVILMTDGVNNAGKVPPLTAAEAAQALAVKVYTIGVGTQGYAPVPQGVDWFGQVVYGREKVEIDEDTLKAIATKTGGRYYRADNTETLRRIYQEIDQLEKSEVEVKKYVQSKELFHWAAIPGLFLVLLEMILNHTVWRRVP